jgi:hypothetical protein
LQTRNEFQAKILFENFSNGDIEIKDAEDHKTILTDKTTMGIKLK